MDYLHNALGQRVFKSVPLAEQTLPDERRLGRGFIEWLREGFGWLFTKGKGGKNSIGQGFAYDENANLLGEYDNGSAQGLGTTEYIWLPVEGANAIPVGIYRNGKLYQVHADHLGTPRLVTDSANAPVWQWPYSAYGNNKTTGVLTATTTSNGQERLRAAKAPVAVNLRFPGQYFDEESNLAYNYMRSYRAGDGRYTQADPIGLSGGLNRYGYVEGNPVSFTDPNGLNPVAGATTGAGVGSAFGPVGTVVGGLAGAGVGAWIGWNVFGPMLAKPPENAYDPNGPKAPGKPSEADGFKDPKGGENWVPNPNGGKGGSGYGWEDAKGDVWCPTGQGGRSHSGPHWDVQTPGGGYRNVKPKR